MQSATYGHVCFLPGKTKHHIITKRRKSEFDKTSVFQYVTAAACVLGWLSAQGGEQILQSPENPAIWWALQDNTICRFGDGTVEKVPLAYGPQSFVLGRVQGRSLLLTHEVRWDGVNVLVVYLRSGATWEWIFENVQEAGVNIQKISVKPPSLASLAGQLRIRLQTSAQTKNWIFTAEDATFLLQEPRQVEILQNELPELLQHAPTTSEIIRNRTFSIQTHPTVRLMQEIGFVEAEQIQSLQDFGMLNVTINNWEPAGVNITSSWILCPLMNEALVQAGYSQPALLAANNVWIHQSFEDLAARFTFLRAGKALIQYNLAHLPQGRFIYEEGEQGFRGFEQAFATDAAVVRYPFSEPNHMEGTAQEAFLKEYLKFLPGIDYAAFFAKFDQADDLDFAGFHADARGSLKQMLQNWSTKMEPGEDGLFSLYAFIAATASQAQRRYMPVDTLPVVL